VLLSVLLITGLVALLAGLVVLTVPQATVRLVPAVIQLEAGVTVIADPTVERVDAERNVIPARELRVQVEGTGQIPTTGRKDIPDAPAGGKVIFINKTSNQVTVPQGTMVRTSTGVNIRFTTVTTVTVPAGRDSKAEAEILAVEGGPGGNVGAFLINNIEGPLSLQLQVINEIPTSGGGVRQVGMVTQGDKERLRASLLQQLQQESYVRLTEKLKPQEVLPRETMEVLILGETYDKFVDEPADFLGLKLQVVAVGLAFGEQDANQLSLQALKRQVPAGYDLSREGLVFEVGKDVQVNEGKVAFSARARGLAVARVDTVAVRDAVRGRDVAEAETYLTQNLPLRQPAVIDLNPNWLGRVPWLPFRVRVVVRPELE